MSARHELTGHHWPPELKLRRGTADHVAVRLSALAVVCVICGVLAGTLLRGSLLARGSGRVDSAEVLRRGGEAARAASALLVAVRWHGGDVQISRVLCDNRTVEPWRCEVRFRSASGRELTGPQAPAVALSFRGAAVEAELASCRLSDPQMGRPVDCAGRVERALRSGR